MSLKHVLLICFSIIAFWLKTTCLCGLSPYMPIMASMSVILQWILHFVLFFEIPNALVMSLHAPKPKRSKAGKAKKIGGRRYSSKRRSKSSYLKRLRGYWKYSARFFFWMIFLWTFNVGWAISGKKRNKYMHCMNGNGPGKGKKGKGRPSTKGSPPTFPEARQTTDAEYEDHDLLEQIKAALPQAAIIRAQSTLDPTEWDAPIVSPQLLDHRGGIALCPRDMVLGSIRSFSASWLYHCANGHTYLTASARFCPQRFSAAKGTMFHLCAQ